MREKVLHYITHGFYRVKAFHIKNFQIIVINLWLFIDYYRKYQLF